MEELIFAARREVTRRGPEPPDAARRFQLLVKSPLRAGILRYLASHKGQPVEIETLMQTFGRLRQDVENCLAQLTEAGVTRRVPGGQASYAAVPLGRSGLGEAVEEFLDKIGD